MGFMAPRIPRPLLELYLPKLVLAYLTMLKKEKYADHLPITQVLGCW